MRPALGSFGAPPDAVAWLCLLLALAFTGVALGPWRWREYFLEPHRGRWLVAALCITAGLASWAYVNVYLRGAPRIIDATSYWLQARTFSTGAFTIELPLPSSALRGRFLVPTSDGTAAAVIFPPGYPAVLALAFVLGKPLLLGPLLAAALVWVTYRLARLTLSREGALCAAALSASSAVLRYHTADTMSHGLAALLFSATLLGAFSSGARAPWIAGIAGGWLCATRPVSGGVAVLIAAALLCTRRRALWQLALALVPGLTLYAVYQYAVTGSAFGSAQRAYYALADGPPGCFTYGFGANVGCLVEHGDFVRARLADGYGLLEAAGTTLRRLWWHLPDAGNFEPFALLVPLAVVIGFRDRVLRTLGASVFGLMLAYAPFYFDGNYPGGGARFFADVLPLEHVLIAAVLARARALRWALPTALAGFALHTSYDHQLLAEREGGRPMFEPEQLAHAGVKPGLLFVSTDHGFNLAFDPKATSPRVARWNRDAHDVLLWDALGRPSAYVYRLSADTSEPTLTPFDPRASSRYFEAEAEWPPLFVDGGFAHVDYPSDACVSGRTLRLRPSETNVKVGIELPVAKPASYDIRLSYHVRPGPPARVSARVADVHADTTLDPRRGACPEIRLPRVALNPGRHRLELGAETSQTALDFIDVSAVP